MIARKGLPAGCEREIREAKICAFVNRTAPTPLNYHRLRLKAKCLCAGRDEFRAFSKKYSLSLLDDARELLGRERCGYDTDWFSDAWAMFGKDNDRAQVVLERGIHACRNCDDAGKEELREMAVGTINRLIGRLLSEDVRLGRMLGILHIKTGPFEEAEHWAARLAEFRADANRALYDAYESCLQYNRELDSGLRMMLRETAVRIAPTKEEREKQLKKFQEECTGVK
jgi:hypothetical protein